LSVTLSEAVNVPVTAGVNVTLMLQFAPAATLVPQLFVSPKSLGFVPVMVMLLTLSAAFPVLVSVTD